MNFLCPHFICLFSSPISAVSSPPKIGVVCAQILCYLIKPSKHSSCLKPPLFFLSLIRDSIKKVNEVCGVLVFASFFSHTKLVTACLSFVNVHCFREVHLTEWSHWQLIAVHISCHVRVGLVSHPKTTMASNSFGQIYILEYEWADHTYVFHQCDHNNKTALKDHMIAQKQRQRAAARAGAKNESKQDM